MRWLKAHFKTIIYAIVGFVVLGVVALQFTSGKYDTSVLKNSNIITHITELNGPEYSGRLAGSDGNEKAMAYIAEHFADIGLVPVGDEGTYFQSFKMMVPQISNEGVFTIGEQNGLPDMGLTLYEDYLLVPYMNGGSVDFEGELLLVGSNLKRIAPEEIEGRVVIIEAARLEQSKVDYVIEHGGKGLLCSADTELYARPRQYEVEKSVHVFGKTGASIAVGYIGRDAYKSLIDRIEPDTEEEIERAMGYIRDANLRMDIDYPIIETANILGMIEGRNKDKTIVISAAMDGLGEGPNGNYFPGAANHLSGIGTLMEIARATSLQETKPNENILFIAYNGEAQTRSGSTYYWNNSVVPLEESRVVLMGFLGHLNQNGLAVIGNRAVSGMFSNLVAAYAADVDVRTTEDPVAFGLVSDLSSRQVPSIFIGQDYSTKDDYYDTAELLEIEAFEEVTKALQNYLKRAVYNEEGIDYLPAEAINTVMILVFVFVVMLLVGITYRSNPRFHINKVTIEQVYHSVILKLIRRFYSILIPIGFAVMLLVFLSSMDPNLNVKIVKDNVESNFSGYLTLKNSLLYFERIAEWDLDELKKLGEVIYESGYRSLILLVSALGLSTVLGVSRGIYEAYRHKKKGLKSVGMLVIFSIPDVLIVLGGVMLYIFIAQTFPTFNEQYAPKEFILPLLTLSVIPTIYISRITFVALREEMSKVYVRNAKAMGLSQWRIFTSELLPSVLFKLIDTLPTIMTMLLTNMIIVEHLFNYIGIVYFLLYFYAKQEADSFVALALTLGTIYLVFTWGIKKAAGRLNPLRKEV